MIFAVFRNQTLLIFVSNILQQFYILSLLFMWVSKQFYPILSINLADLRLLMLNNHFFNTNMKILDDYFFVLKIFLSVSVITWIKSIKLKSNTPLNSF